MLNVPLPWLTFVTPPNELLEPDFWCNRAELTSPDLAVARPPLAEVFARTRPEYAFAIFAAPSMFDRFERTDQNMSGE
jgi:hypothetical protein